MHRFLRRPWHWAVTWWASSVIIALCCLLAGCEGDYTILVQDTPVAFYKNCDPRQGSAGLYVLRCQSGGPVGKTD